MPMKWTIVGSHGLDVVLEPPACVRVVRTREKLLNDSYGLKQAPTRYAGFHTMEPKATRRPWLGKSSEASGTRRVVRSFHAVERSRLPPKAGAGKRDSFNLFRDILYFVLLYLVWSLLYLQLIGKSLVSASAAPVQMEPINVTKGSQVSKLDPANICCIKASGDYVEFCTSAESYLKSGTISFYERALENGPFFGIHRS